MDVERSRPGDQLAAVAPGARAPLPSAALAELPRRVARTYLLVGAASVVAIDLAVAAFGADSASDRAPEIAKGVLFVAATAVALWAVVRQLTERFDRMFLRSITAERDFYSTVLSTSSDIVAILDGDGQAVYVNDAVTDVLGWRPREVVGRPGRELVHQADRAAAVGFWEAAAADRTPSQLRTFLLRHRDGSYRAMEVTAAAISLAGGALGVVFNARDVTERARSERQLRAALAEDVTGLPDLRMFLAEMELIDNVRPEGLAATVALVDVDRFGDINELHGRSGGDEVLREVARRITASVPEALGVWRHGADEFAVAVVGFGDTTVQQSLADRIQGVADAPIVLDEDRPRVSIELSVGVARVDVDARPDDEPLGTLVLRAAETALAEAKKHPDRVAVHLEHPAARPPDRARLVAELRDALDRGELVVHYQPKVRLDDLRLAGVEALVRWEHPTRGLLAPGEFLPAVAEGNLSAAVLRVVLHDALGRCVGWLEAPGCAPEFMVCVNVSADDMRRRRFVDDVFAALDESGVDPRRLCLELTEQTMVAEPVAARDVVDRLRREGIQVAIDDFGTGYSTLEHIRVFEVDEIKIDKGFVHNLGSSPADEAIVDSVLAMTERLGVRVVAEGIEHVTALGYLRDRGCQLGQGYLLSRPIPPEEIDPRRRWAALA